MPRKRFIAHIVLLFALWLAIGLGFLFRDQVANAERLNQSLSWSTIGFSGGVSQGGEMTIITQFSQPVRGTSRSGNTTLQIGMAIERSPEMPSGSGSITFMPLMMNEREAVVVPTPIPTPTPAPTTCTLAEVDNANQNNDSRMNADQIVDSCLVTTITGTFKDTGNVEMGDLDLYAFRLDRSTTVNAQILTLPEGVSAAFLILNEGGTPAVDGDSQTVINTRLEAGNYFLFIQQQGGSQSNGQYRLRFSKG